LELAAETPQRLGYSDVRNIHGLTETDYRKLIREIIYRKTNDNKR